MVSYHFLEMYTASVRIHSQHTATAVYPGADGSESFSSAVAVFDTDHA